jgi:polysaccharide export outer membrane protein
MRYLIIIYLFVAVAFTSCSYKQDQILLQQKNNILDTSSTRPYANISNYRIKPQDILQINNVQASKSLVDVTAGVINNGSPGLTPLAQADTYTVEEDGTVALTGLGRV